MNIYEKCVEGRGAVNFMGSGGNMFYLVKSVPRPSVYADCMCVCDDRRQADMFNSLTPKQTWSPYEAPDLFSGFSGFSGRYAHNNEGRKYLKYICIN